MTFRTLLAAFMFISALSVWWVGAVCALLLSVRYRAWEVVILGALFDIFWLPSDMVYGFPIATSLSLIIVWALEPLRRQFLFDYD